MERTYFCIDLKSFYASVECADRGLDPMRTNLVVADISRGLGTLCLAVSPSLKKLGIQNRCRLYEIPSDLQFVIAKPRMKAYIKKSSEIYAIYLKYIAKEDILVYSIDECFLDVTHYLKMYNLSKEELAKKIMLDVYLTTSIQATVGIGTNMFLAKVALDIKAKNATDFIYFLDEEKFKKELWFHRPLTDFFKIGKGISNRLAKMGIYDLHGITTIEEKILYDKFGVDAELLIDHAYGRESCTIKDVHLYIRKENSLSSGQVLFEDYTYVEGILVIKEMVELLVLDLIKKKLVTKRISLSIGYSKNEPSSHKSLTLDGYTSSIKKLTECFLLVYKQICQKNFLIRKITISLSMLKDNINQEYDLFSLEKEIKEEKLLKTINEIKYRYGNNAILRGMNLQKKATTKLRNKLIGGHNG